MCHGKSPTLPLGKRIRLGKSRPVGGRPMSVLVRAIALFSQVSEAILHI